VGLVSIGTAALGGLFLAPDMPATGAALAASLAFWTQSLLLAFWLMHDRLWAPVLPLLRLVLVGTMAAAAMAVVIAWLGAGISAGLVGHQAGLREFALLAALCAAGLCVYAAAAYALGALRTGLAIQGIGKSTP
jgi:peptidoglycan biosynthesis protein MviN/MurJ (putative lipid II flippase)